MHDPSRRRHIQVVWGKNPDGEGSIKNRLHSPEGLLLRRHVDGVEAKGFGAVGAGQRLDETGDSVSKKADRSGLRAAPCGQAGLIDDKRIVWKLFGKAD
jgi:hypothetical protein